MTFVPSKPTANDDVLAKQRTEDVETQELLREIIVELKLQNEYLKIITDTELDESDVQGS